MAGYKTITWNGSAYFVEAILYTGIQSYLCVGALTFQFAKFVFEIILRIGRLEEMVSFMSRESRVLCARAVLPSTISLQPRRKRSGWYSKEVGN